VHAAMTERSVYTAHFHANWSLHPRSHYLR